MGNSMMFRYDFLLKSAFLYLKGGARIFLMGVILSLVCMFTVSAAEEEDPFHLPEDMESGEEDLQVEAVTEAANHEEAEEPDAARTDEPKEEGLPRINNVFYDTDLRQALQDIGAEAGVNILAGPAVGGIVSAELEDAPLDKALELVLAGTGFEVGRKEDYYLIYSPDESSTSFLDVSDTKFIEMNHVEAERALRLLPSRLRNFARADDRSDVIVVTAPPPQMSRIVSDLKTIDRPRKHVLLDARVVVLERSSALDLGVDWNFPQIQAGSFTSSHLHDESVDTLWPWGVRIGYTPGREFTNALILTLNLMTQNEEASIVASPQLLVQDAERAEVRVTTEEYFEIITEGATYLRSQLETIETGTLLNIVPRIGNDGKVKLEMEIEVSDVVARGEANLPVVNRRTAQSTVQIESGGTAAIAGLLDTRTTEGRRDVPGMGGLPVIGRFFRSDTARHKESQIAVFITATVLEHEDEQFQTGQRRSTRAPKINENEFRRQLLHEMRKEQFNQLFNGSDR